MAKLQLGLTLGITLMSFVAYASMANSEEIFPLDTMVTFTQAIPLNRDKSVRDGGDNHSYTHELKGGGFCIFSLRGSHEKLAELPDKMTLQGAKKYKIVGSNLDDYPGMFNIYVQSAQNGVLTVIKCKSKAKTKEEIAKELDGFASFSYEKEKAKIETPSPAQLKPSKDATNR